MDNEYHEEEDRPTAEGTRATGQLPRIEQETNGNGTENLRGPVGEVVQPAGTDGEQRSIVVVEF